MTTSALRSRTGGAGKIRVGKTRVGKTTGTAVAIPTTAAIIVKTTIIINALAGGRKIAVAPSGMPVISPVRFEPARFSPRSGKMRFRNVAVHRVGDTAEPERWQSG